MRLQHLKAILKAAASGAAVLLLGVGVASAQQQVNLTAGPTTLTLPDGVTVPMWGYTCGAVVSGSTATCAAANPNATGWSPVIIKVPTGQTLQVNLTNNLSFGASTVPTSMVIVGQLGGGLGTVGAGCTGGTTCTDSPVHSNSVTWPIADPTPIATQVQGKRVQSFSTEVAAGVTTGLTWTTPRPGTYLLESGTHPSIQASMGLIGMLVVTAPGATAISGFTAYPGVSYNADAKLIFSEIDPVQNADVQAAVMTPGFSETKVWSGVAGGCGIKLNSDGSPNPAYHTCYPPVVNYKPLYYLINGVAFNKANAANSQIAASPSAGVLPGTGKVLVRMVNAGSRMHVPSIVGSTTNTPAAGGFSLIAEDGNLLPGTPRVQTEVFMAAGKTYDVMINAPAAGGTALPVFDRELSLSGNGSERDAGMLAYLSVNGAGLPVVPGAGTVKANADIYNGVSPTNTLTISDPAKGVIANDTNIFGVQLITPPTAGTLTLNANGTFTYVPTASSWTSDTFHYCGNGATSGPACADVTLGLSTVIGSSITLCTNDATACNYLSNVASALTVRAPGVLKGATDPDPADASANPVNLPLTVSTTPANVTPGLTVTLNKDGSFTASVAPNSAGPYSFDFTATNPLGTTATATANITFPAGGGLKIKVVDGADPNKSEIGAGYRWIIEEDRTFFSDPACTGNPPAAGCPGNGAGVVPNFGTNFHTSHMPVIATGCTDTTSCGNDQTVNGLAVAPRPFSKPGDVAVCTQDLLTAGQPCLDPKKRYFISVLPGDAAQPFIGGWGQAPEDCLGTGPMVSATCGHGMGGAPIPKLPVGTADYSNQTTITVITEPTPYPPATLSVFVFEDDYPLNGEHDAGGGVDVLSPNEAGLGGFQITLQDDAGGTGDATGTPTYDMFNMPLSNSLAGTLDPVSHLDACPLSTQVTAASENHDSSQNGIVGMIITCPTFESDGKTMSPLAGQAIVKNLWQGRYGVVANPAADRIAKGEEWLQTNTLDGQKAHDSFMRIGEPAYFQEFGPAGYHVTIGFANPTIINERGKALCAPVKDANGNVISTPDCAHEVKGHVTTARMSRTPDERLYGSETHDSYAFTQCYISLGDPDGAEFMFTKCNPDGSFDFKGVPAGNWKVTTFDQWNDQVVDGITTAVAMCAPQSALSPNPPTSCLGNDGHGNVDMGEIAVHQWQSNIYTRTFIDTDYSGVSNDKKPGLALVDTNIRFRDGSFSNFNNTDLDGFAGFNEVFPLFNWYVVETDSTRYKNSGTHVVYDSGGPVDGSAACGTNGAKPCGDSGIADHMANTYEPNPLPADLSVPGAVYCQNADCSAAGEAISSAVLNGALTHPSGPGVSAGRIDPAWVNSYGWQGFSGQNNFLEFGKRPFDDGENGGIYGHVVYASTRPFDDPQLLLQLSWEPQVPHVRINLYKEGVASDGVTSTLTLVDHTETSSFDDWAQGFRQNPDGSFVKGSDGNYVPNMSCPGQGTDDMTGEAPDPYFWFALKGQPQYLDIYNNDGTITKPMAHDAQFKCYDGMHNWNQLQPAPYDGAYRFPSVTAIDPVTGKPAGTNCTACIANPTSADSTIDHASPHYDPYRTGTPMLPAGKYVVEVVVPEGFELVKEEDKNILIGDNFIAPVTQQFGGLASIFILPDQATIANPSDPLNLTQDLGRTTLPSHEADTGSVETFWPCVGADHIVPDFISLFPLSGENAPFAGATRKLCDRKEVTLNNQTSALAKFYVFTETHTAAHFTGVITDDFTAEFDPFSPQFGEKYGPAYLPVSFKDWAGNEIDRVYTDAWGAYNGLSYSTWEVNPPNPTGYGPTMMVGCMNDATRPDGTPDPLFQDGYSQFCYELPFMPGQTGYFDTPVVPTSAFAGGYNNPDCAYPDATPAISRVDGDVVGPWVSGAGKTLIIKSLGDLLVDNTAYSGPAANSTPFNQQKVKRHYGFLPQCASLSDSCKAVSSVVLVSTNPTTHVPVTTPLTITNWADDSITATIPSTPALGSATGVQQCSVQQQTQFGGSTAYCGELVITAGNGQQSIDTVTVTIGGKTPTVITDKTPLSVSGFGAIQQAIDSAKPGDLLIVGPGVHSEMVLMWKPVRLQGVGAATSIIDANPHPAGRLNPWRQRVVCLFGLALDGTPISATHPYDPSNPASTGCPANMKFSVDRLPLEATVGWDATLNGNLAEQLIEPTLMGAYEGAGITVLGKGVRFPNGSDPFASDAFPTGTTLLDGRKVSLNGRNGDPNGCGPDNPGQPNPNPSNFYCNPSSIDGLTIQNSSQGGGAIWVHAWGHELQIANNRLTNNQGTMSGGLTVGQGEHPDAFLAGQAATATVPGSCIPDNGVTTNLALPYCNNVDVNVHHNSVTLNSSLGDELFSSTPAGAGGVTFCNGSDYYKFNYNWVCGNMSTGDGAGVAHVGFTYDGDIEHNAILYNQTTNPTIVTNGGGLLIMGAPDADPPCGLTTDVDCVPNAAQGGFGSILPSDGTGPGLVINANLIQGNSADSGSGGGLRLQHVNGTDVLNFHNGNATTNWPTITGHPAQPDFQRRTRWNAVQITNNIIANNVAGIDGGGVSLLDALAVDIVNNTIVSNNSTASSGVLLQTLFAPLSSTMTTADHSNCTAGPNNGQSCPQVAGLVSVTNSPVLTANIGSSSLACPLNHGPNCKQYSSPVLYNNLFWQNRSYVVGVTTPTATTTGQTNQQSTVTMYVANFAGTATALAQTQAATGACADGNTAGIWDIGVRGSAAPGVDASGLVLAPQRSVFTNSNEALEGSNNTSGDALLTASYCNGSRVPPEAKNNLATGQGPGSPYLGWLAPPGTNESNALPAPPFTLMPGATVDEGNNWINLRWGPLSINHPVTGATLMNAVPKTGSPVIDEVLVQSTPAFPQFNPYSIAPSVDFYGNSRKTPGNQLVDAGAIEIVPTPTFSASVSPATLNFGAVANGQNSTLNVTITNAGNQQLTGLGLTFGATQFTRNGGTCTANLAPGATCTVGVRFTAPAAGTTALANYNSTLTLAYTNAAVTGSPVGLLATSSPMVVNPASLNFGSIGAVQPPGTPTSSAAQTLTVRNGSGSARPVTIGAFPAGFSRATAAQGGGGSCSAANLNSGATCTINVVFTPTATQLYSGNLSITSTVAVANSPVALSGNGVDPVRTATLTPTSWSPTQARNCPSLACTFTDPTQTFTLTNTGNVALTGIAQGALSGTNTADFTVVGLLSSCGPTGNGQFTSNVTLAPGATCAVSVGFRPLTSEPAGPKTSTIGVTDSFGTQSVNITATAN